MGRTHTRDSHSCRVRCIECDGVGSYIIGGQDIWGTWADEVTCARCNGTGREQNDDEGST